MSISFEQYHLKDLRDKFENREFAVPVSKDSTFGISGVS